MVLIQHIFMQAPPFGSIYLYRNKQRCGTSRGPHNISLYFASIKINNSQKQNTNCIYECNSKSSTVETEPVPCDLEESRRLFPLHEECWPWHPRMHATIQHTDHLPHRELEQTDHHLIKAREKEREKRDIKREGEKSSKTVKLNPFQWLSDLTQEEHN